MPGGSAFPTPAPATSDGAAAPWSRVGPGPLGLLNSLLRYLVDARREAGDRGDTGYRAIEPIHDEAGAGHGLSVAATRSALFELEAYRLVESTDGAELRWRATDAGITAMIAAATSAGS